MKIDDYDFHKKLSKLLAWCKPGISYSLNEKGLIKYNELRIRQGLAILTQPYVANLNWFCIEDGSIKTRYCEEAVVLVEDINYLEWIFRNILLAGDGTELAELMLDPSNLAEV